MAETKKSPKDYDRWGTFGVKVIKLPTQTEKKTTTKKATKK